MPAPWKFREARPALTVKRRTMYGKTPYDVMSDGSLRNTNHQRHERRFYGLSARQHRLLTKQLRRGGPLKREWRQAIEKATGG